MHKNMGSTDRLLRAFVVAPVLLLIAFLAVEPLGVASVVLIGLAVVMIATSAVGTCPLYAPFGISTCSRPDAKQ